MISLSTNPAMSHSAAAKIARAVLTYILPALAIFYVILSGMWLVPDSFFGIYGNFDGHWESWGARGILEWSGFLDFSPVSPLAGTGSLFPPNLPWLNPAALALAMPGPLELRHLASTLIYLTELSASLYFLYRHLEFSQQQSFLATILYVCIFFIPLNAYTQAPVYYSLAPMNAHLVAAMNVATIALIRVGYERLVFKALFGFIFIAALFVAFASAPITSVTYIPIYGVLWIALLTQFRAEKDSILWQWGTIALALLMLVLIGMPSYLAATAMTSARGGSAPPIFHAGWRLLSPAYWQELVSNFPVCSVYMQINMQLMCPWSIIGWFEIAALGGAIFIFFADSGAKRRYGLAILALLALLHFYALLYTGKVLGPLNVVAPPYLMWAFFPVAGPAAVSAGRLIVRLVAGRRPMPAWMPPAASCLIAAVAVFVWVQAVLPNQPRLPGRGPFGLPPIAHVPVTKGPIIEYLRDHIGLTPGSEFHGYASTFFGASDGLVRKSTKTPANIMTWDAYVAARDIVFNHFGNSFQMMDLWNDGIPTFEEYGQWLSKPMFYFHRDLLAEPQDQIDPFEHTLLVFRFRPMLLRVLGVRFVIADGTLSDPLIERVMMESGKDGAIVNLYEIKGANIGQLSPTQVIWAADYSTAVRILRAQADFEQRVVLLGDLEQPLRLVRASRARLFAIRDGYRLTASAPGTAMLLLPVQFTHCWRIENGNDSVRVLRANIVQTGVLFKEAVDVQLRFDFEPWKTSCRFEDARDISRFGFK
jgi:hypothetical protein